MSSLENRKIVLGVCGSIAAYKSAYLLRELQKKGAEVRVAMTPSAAKFVAPLTFSSLSHRPVAIDMFPERGSPTAVEHVDLGLWADAMLIAPATASTIAKLAYGIADNLLTSTALALRAPLVVAPAMDADMYIHPATSRNIFLLKERGVFVVEPVEGELASGLIGVGRLAEVEKIMGRVVEIFEGHNRDFAGKRVLVTAGPTQEPIDAVRFISNRSSGKMGFSIASAAANRGADVTLIAGPVSLETPRNVKRRDVATADEMCEVVLKSFESCDVLVMAAAVSDYRLTNPMDRKIKKKESSGGTLRIELVENPDILQLVAGRKGKRIVVGFALETDDPITNAREKLKSKSMDLIVVNNPKDAGAGFGTETNKVTILSGFGEEAHELPVLPKYEVALRILDSVRMLF